MNPIRFGIVGCGKISDRHMAAIQSIKDAELLAASDLNEERLKKTATAFGIKNIYSDYAEMLQNPQVDVVTICTPSGLHARMIQAALSSGKHVLCEKPLAMTVKEAEAVNDLAKQKNLHLLEVKQNRYSSAVQMLRNAVTEGWLGKILLGNATVRWNRTQEYYNQADWFGTKAMDGGVVLNQAIHHIDLLRWLMGPPVAVFAKAMVLSHNIEAADTALAIVQFKSGAYANLELTTCAAPTNIEGSVTIMGDRGTIKIGGKALDAFEIWQVSGHEQPKINEQSLSNHARLYSEIVALLSGKKIDTLTTGEDALQSLLLAEAILTSSDTQSEIVIDHATHHLQQRFVR